MPRNRRAVNVIRIRIAFSCSRLRILLLGALLTAPAAAQEVEIIQGIPGRVEPAATGPGIRVIAFVQLSPERREYAVVRPLLADEILAVQRALSAVGYETGARDGILGPGTGAALKAFQSDRGLEPCGCIDWATAMSLGFRPRVTQTVLGLREDEPQAEIVMPAGRLTPERPVAPPTNHDTVVVVRDPGSGAWWEYPVLGVFPLSVIPSGGKGAVPPGATSRGGVPFGGSATRGRASFRTGRPPPR